MSDLWTFDDEDGALHCVGAGDAETVLRVHAETTTAPSRATTPKRSYDADGSANSIRPATATPSSCRAALTIPARS
jgi:hypothetical protein